MFDGYIFTPGSLADVEVDGDVVGFEMRTRIPFWSDMKSKGRK